MNVLQQILASLTGLNTRALLHKGLLVTALVAFATVAIPIAGAVTGHTSTSTASADPECEAGDEECKARPTKTPDDYVEPTKTPKKEEPTKTPTAMSTATPVDTATPTDVPTNTPENTPTTTMPTDRPAKTPTFVPTDTPTETKTTPMPTETPAMPVALPDSGSGFGPDLVLTWYWYALVGALVLVGLGVLIKPSYD
jgi:hypothetical protein